MKKFLLFLAVLAFTFMANAQTEYLTFEDGEFNSLFTNDDTYPWTIESPGHNSNYCMRSGNATVASSTSAISMTITFNNPGFFYFDSHCMGEGTSTFWDHCDFSIDGTVVYTHGADLGNVWDSFLTNIEAGEHTFEWSYTKDGSVNPTGDYFEVDNIAVGYGDPCTKPFVISVTSVSGTTNISWDGYSSSFTLRYKHASTSEWTEVPGITDHSYTITGLADGAYEVQVQSDCDPDNWESINFNVGTSGYSYVTLVHGDNWGDGSGYQMLFDADATAYGDIIPASGPLTSSGDAPAGLYDAFEYKIPENAEGVLTTPTVVINGSATIVIPAGIYDWAITNPTPGDRVWIASSQGNIGGRADDFMINPYCMYTFTVTKPNNNDAVDMTVVVSGESVPEVSQNGYTYYPNPAKNYLMVESESMVDECTIFSISGQKMYSKTVNAESFDLNVESLPAGVYILRLVSNGEVQNCRFVKE